MDTKRTPATLQGRIASRAVSAALQNPTIKPPPQSSGSTSSSNTRSAQGIRCNASVSALGPSLAQPASAPGLQSSASRGSMETKKDREMFAKAFNKKPGRQYLTGSNAPEPSGGSSSTANTTPAGSARPISASASKLRSKHSSANLPSQTQGRLPTRPRPASISGANLVPVRLRSEFARQAQGFQEREVLHKVSSSEELKVWFKGRMIAPGVLDLSGLDDDGWLRGRSMSHPGKSDAPLDLGTTWWKMIDDVFQKGEKVIIHTLSLSNSGFKHLRQLDTLPLHLPNLRALDLSFNPIQSVTELDHWVSGSSRKMLMRIMPGGWGPEGLRGLVELKCMGCQFREYTLQGVAADAHYKHDLLVRFPSLQIIDGVTLERPLFPLERKTKIAAASTGARRAMLEKKLAAMQKDMTFPFDVKADLFQDTAIHGATVEFCARFFPLFDQDRAQCILAYAPTAVISVSTSKVPVVSRSLALASAQEKAVTQDTSLLSWDKVGTRNLRFGTMTVEDRVDTLKTPENLLQWLSGMVPKTVHPMTDPSKWCVDAWALDGEGAAAKVCVMVQGQFEEVGTPIQTYRSFSRTFILITSPHGSPALSAGWRVMVLSDTMIVHPYHGTAAFDDRRSVAFDGVKILPPALPPSLIGETSSPSELAERQKALVEQMCHRTGMNPEYSVMCLQENQWDVDRSVNNFEDVRAAIPPGAFL